MKKIRLIEVNPVRENASEILALSGPGTMVAENGRIGVDMARGRKPGSTPDSA